MPRAGRDSRRQQAIELVVRHGYDLTKPNHWRLEKDGLTKSYVSLRDVLLAVMTGKNTPNNPKKQMHRYIPPLDSKQLAISRLEVLEENWDRVWEDIC